MSKISYGFVVLDVGASVAIAGGCFSKNASDATNTSDAAPPADMDATSSEAGADADATPGPDPAAIATSCGAYATAYCAALGTCFDTEPSARFGKKENWCRASLDCKTRFGLNDVAVETAALDTCTAALPAANCAALLDDVLPAACDYAKGKRANGLPCIDRAQCSSGHCEPTANTACGACANPPRSARSVVPRSWTTAAARSRSARATRAGSSWRSATHAMRPITAAQTSPAPRASA